MQSNREARWGSGYSDPTPCVHGYAHSHYELYRRIPRLSRLNMQEPTRAGGLAARTSKPNQLSWWARD